MKLSQLKSALGLVLLGLTLTSCVGSGVYPSPTPSRVDLAVLPSDLRRCFTNLVGAPPAGDLNSHQVAGLIVQLKQSEMHKSRCGKRFIAWYDTQARVFRN